MNNLLLVMKDYNSTCGILKKFNINLYLYDCNTTKFKNVSKLDDTIFEYIDIIIVNDNLKKEIIENLVNSFKGNKLVYLFSNLKFNIANDKCVFQNYIKIDKIISFFNDTNKNTNKELPNCLSNKTIKKSIDNKYYLNNVDLNKIKFRDLCLTMLDYFCNVEIPEIIMNQSNEAVFIEYRPLPHTEVLLRNCISKLGSDWSYTIICGEEAFSFYAKLCNNIHKNIKVINTGHQNMDQNTYNKFLLTKDFWYLLSGEKILIYQEDTFIFKDNINDFVEWDYIGAPFKIDCVEGNNVGNGGLSLRSKSKMLEVLDKVPLECVDKNKSKSFVQKYISNKKLDNIPEDIYYSTYLQKLNIGKVPDIEIAKQFSSETIYNPKSFGMHCMWHCCKDWENVFVNTFNKKPHSSICENNVNFTRPLFTEPLDFIKNKTKINLDIVDSFVMIVDFYNGGGGTTTFLNFLVSKYKYYNNFIIIRENNSKCFVTLNDDYFIFDDIHYNDFFDIIISNINKLDFVFVNHFYRISEKFIDKIFELKKFNKKIITITHDYYFFNKKIQPLFVENFDLNKKKFTDNFDKILTQHTVNLSYFRADNVSVIDMPDYKNRFELIDNTDKKKCVGIIGNISNIKGLDVLKHLVNLYSDINFIIFGNAIIKETINLKIHKYSNIKELNSLLKVHKPSILLELSKWPETYSYTLTLAHIINLPLLILKKPRKSVVVERAKSLGIEYYIFESFEEIYELVNNKSKYHFYTIEPKIYFNSYFDQLFVKKFHKNIILPSKTTLDKYYIYFPQFYEIPENNINFYNGYSDSINLYKLQNSNYLNEILTPNFEYFNINNVANYDLYKNNSIIKKQVDILKEYNSGIACYYYWFTLNTITGKNMIMKETIDLLFNECKKKNNSIFFIWANEDWSKNEAFGNSNGNNKILNHYDDDNIISNFNNLLDYFKHKCYLKRNNKPIFMIYHTWFISYDELNNIKKIFDELCIKNGFNGCEIYLNTMNEYNLFDKNIFKKFKINFDYKTNKGSRYYIDNQIVLDYEKYIDIMLPLLQDNDVQTISLDFDNNARLFEPKKSELSTLCINNYHFLKILFLKEIARSYKNLDSENIVLVNSLNEWGEKMACEPSNETGYYYLNLLNEYL
jgi:hypothetical protein